MMVNLSNSIVPMTHTAFFKSIHWKIILQLCSSHIWRCKGPEKWFLVLCFSHSIPNHKKKKKKKPRWRWIMCQNTMFPNHKRNWQSNIRVFIVYCFSFNLHFFLFATLQGILSYALESFFYIDALLCRGFKIWDISFRGTPCSSLLLRNLEV